MKSRRWLYLIHRWLGISLCLLMAMWFCSGMVMIYVGFPELTRAERLSSLPPLRSAAIANGPEALLASLDPAQPIASLRLTSVLGRPAYLLGSADGTTHGQFADSGELFNGFGTADAIAAAQSFASRQQTDSASATYHDLVEMDQWSISSGLDIHRPLHLVALNDRAGTELYISSLTGEVMRDTTATERSWNWLGANLHWIYPFQLRRHATVWHWLILVLSLAGLLSIITGAIVGVLRLRIRNPYRGRDLTPYRGTMKLHHILGLCLLVPLTTYMFSGLMSMNPWGVFSDDLAYSEQLSAYRRAPTAAELLAESCTGASLRRTLQATSDQATADVRELVWQWLDGKPYPYVVTGAGTRYLALSPGRDDLEQSALAQLGKIMAGHQVAAIERLDSYDSYYYSHHQRWRPLPVLRVRFDDPADSWFHIDLTSGELINRLTATGRAERWLFSGLHSLDFGFLINNRPLWDLLVIALCVSGFVFSATATLIGWRRLRPRQKHRRATAPSTSNNPTTTGTAEANPVIDNKPVGLPNVL